MEWKAGGRARGRRPTYVVVGVGHREHVRELRQSGERVQFLHQAEGLLPLLEHLPHRLDGLAAPFETFAQCEDPVALQGAVRRVQRRAKVLLKRRLVPM